MVRLRIIGFTTGRSQDNAECGILELETDTHVKFVLKNMQEGLPRPMLKVTAYDAIGPVPYIPNIVSEKVAQIPIGFPQDKGDVTISGSLNVMNDTAARRAVTTHDISFQFDGEAVDWKPTRVDRIMVLRPNEGVRMRFDTVTDSILGSKDDNSLFRIAKVHPCEVSKDRWRICYKLQDTMTVEQVIRGTLELVLRTLKRLRTGIFAVTSDDHAMTFDMFERETTGAISWICDKSIANIIMARALAPGSGVQNCVVKLSPDQIRMVQLMATTAAGAAAVPAALRTIVQGIEKEFEELIRGFERCKKQKRKFIDMMRQASEDCLAFKRYAEKTSAWS